MGTIDYLESVFATDEKTVVVVGGKDQVVRRGDFGVHLRLGVIESRINSAETAHERAAAIIDYLVAAGVQDMRGSSDISGMEAISAYVELRELNRMRGELPFMMMGGGGATYDPPPYDYPSRGWALWVHRLASRYHWTRHYIFSLPPEEVACYIQEVMLADLDDIETIRSLSELSYTYDKVSGKSRFIPTPRPAWMVNGNSKNGNINRKPRPVPVVMPVGNVVDISGMGLINEHDTITSNGRGNTHTG